MAAFHTGLFTFRNGGMLLAKTNYTAVAVFDGDMDATQAFISLIARKISIAISQEMLAKSKLPCYTTDKVPTTQNLASGLCG